MVPIDIMDTRHGRSFTHASRGPERWISFEVPKRDRRSARRRIGSVMSRIGAETTRPARLDLYVSLYERIGGEPALRALVDAFYDLVENDPDAEVLHVLHLKGHGVAHSRIEQFNFLSGFLGGPQLYIERYGHSNVKEMHRHVEVGPAERDAWISCMARAVERVGLAPDAAELLMTHLRRVANVLEIENRTNEAKRLAALRQPPG